MHQLVLKPVLSIVRSILSVGGMIFVCHHSGFTMFHPFLPGDTLPFMRRKMGHPAPTVTFLSFRCPSSRKLRAPTGPLSPVHAPSSPGSLHFRALKNGARSLGHTETAQVNYHPINPLFCSFGTWSTWSFDTRSLT